MTSLNAAALQQGFDDFYAPRQEGDIDLVVLVRKILVKEAPGFNIQYFDNDSIVVEAKDKQPHIQRWLLNRYWTRVFCAIANTMEIRLSLINNGTEEDWLRLFKTNIVPFINQCPAMSSIGAIVS